ncbi:MAG TPA: hypothetical protein VGJ44_26895 [Kribbellaceae bacterium]|jgi:hypothetical protein
MGPVLKVVGLVGVREDVERIRSGIREAEDEVGLWFDRWVAGTISQDEFEARSKPASDRLDALQRERDRLRSRPGDLSATDLDVLIADVGQCLDEAIRRRELLSGRVFASAADTVAREIVDRQIRTLDLVMTNLKAEREERARFMRRAMEHLARAVDDGVIDRETMDRLRTYLE